MLKFGTRVMVHTYKHSGELYRSWELPIVILENEHMVVVMNDGISIYTNAKKPRSSVERTLWFFFKNKWFNYIVTYKPEGLRYYVNLASPFIYEEQSIKYIDYDLDYKLLPNGEWQLLDRKEYEDHSIQYDYPEEIKRIIAKAQVEIEQFIKSQRMNIEPTKIVEIFNKYEDYLKKNKYFSKQVLENE